MKQTQHLAQVIFFLAIKLSSFASAFVVVSSTHQARGSCFGIINHPISFLTAKRRIDSVYDGSLKTTIERNEDLEKNASLIRISFSHIHLFVNTLEDLSIYKELEDKINRLSSQLNGQIQLDKARNIWNTIDTSLNGPILSSSSLQHDSDFLSQNRDLVKQLIAGLGFRITAARYPSMLDSENQATDTRSVLVTSRDPNGVQIVITAVENKNGLEGTSVYKHFDSNEVHRFFLNNSNRQGIATLAFEITEGDIEVLHNNYLTYHPTLIAEDFRSDVMIYYEPSSSEHTKVLEVFAYYENEKIHHNVDRATKLRFIQRCSSSQDLPQDRTKCPLPGLVPVSAKFDLTCMDAYFDHWVSNVISRTSFMETMYDVLGFTPKVDFNAGVVAAGEAQIESTVIGNDSRFRTLMNEEALKDQSQVYLPINNALSEVGHVHGFLREIGQGIQHIASRVQDLAKFVQRGNDFRKITGEGFTFLKIPRSYYGVLTRKMLIDESMANGHSLSFECATAIMDVCVVTGIISPDGAVDLDITREEIIRHLNSTLPLQHLPAFTEQEELIVDIIMYSRYINLKTLLGDTLNDEKYLSIVTNQILVDVQGDDLLLQIFTSNILQRTVGEEAPFFEYIERVCSDSSKAVIRSGCGGFGIRNFLTLFLSIEVSKAMLEVVRAKKLGDNQGVSYAQRMVDIFTDQLNESNPILNEISGAMKEEGNALMALESATLAMDEEAIITCKKKVSMASSAKNEGSKKLMACSTKYMNMMRSLRLSNMVSTA